VPSRCYGTRMHHPRVCLVVVALLVTWGPLLLAGAVAAITVSGTVRDASGSPVPAAEVALLTAELTGIARTKTDAEGRFTLVAPAPGTYLLIARAKAFDEVRQVVIVVNADVSAVDIVIHPAGLREEVTVTSRGWVSTGADNVFGTADDRLTATGETLAQIQDRVLGTGVNASSLVSAIPGYGTFGVRAAFRAGPHQVTLDVENLNDRNYRGVSWGMDAPGRGVTVKYLIRF
jgi:hypothetical protein